MKKNCFKSLIFAFVCGFYALGSIAAVSLFSDYGQIQNVQNYSSNPFWSPNSPYNQRLPQPVYATGADLNAEDCIKVVQSLVSVQCMARDNCKDTDLSDIRPTVMVQLSNLPGANYVSACSGYIDGVFESYKRQYGNKLPNRQTAFPNATVPNPDIEDTGGIKFENPYKREPTKWQTEQKERSDELAALQAQNGVGNEYLSTTDFPATYADLSFSERIKNDRNSLMPYKDAHPYRTLNIISTAEWCKDSDHKNSEDCLNWLCNGNGKEAKTQKCITYRCSKSDYYDKNKEECKRNQLCAKNKNSEECMRYRCYETTDKDLNECKKWKCANDPDFYDANIDMCLQFDCSINNFDNATDRCKQYLCGSCSENPSDGKHTTDARCIRYLCDTCNVYKDANPNSCSETVTVVDPEGNPEAGTTTGVLINPPPEPSVGQDCTPDYPDHVKVAQVNLSGKCEIIECDEGYEQNQDWTKCEKEDNIILTIVNESGSNNNKPRKCFNTCRKNNWTDDGLSRTLQDEGLLAQDKNVCALPGDDVIYYSDDITKPFSVPKSKLNYLKAAISRLKNSNHYDCYPILISDVYYIVIRDANTKEALSGKMYLVQ